MDEEYYFCLHLTESEHNFVKYDIEEYCKNNKLQLKYYRKFKNGHIPMYREVKVIGKTINRFKQFLKINMIENYIVKIPNSARISPEEGKRQWELIKEQYKETSPIFYRTMEEQYK